MPSYADQIKEALQYLRMFGVEEVSGQLILRHGAFWLTTASEIPEGVNIHSIGVRLLRAQEHGLKPTSFGLMLLGPKVKSRRVEVSRRELRELLLGRGLRKPGLPQGYVALCLDGEVLGCGEVRGEVLRCQIPLGRRQELLNVLTHEEKRRAMAKAEPKYNGEKGEPVESPEDVLKGAILLEEWGRIFYQHAAMEAKSAGVKEIFSRLAHEEENHKEFLIKMLSELIRTGGVQASSPSSMPVTSGISLDQVKKEIEVADFEAAAIYAGMALEERAVAFYAEKAKVAPPALAQLYRTLANWEQTHLDLLAAWEEDIRQRIWHERGFWPLD
ncbi:MAG: hypothetical protein NZ651_03185 [Candidatus Bipolaricaulota bacterium]|nr:hypothetical protein [Candidatus Bipolaricaulota bacterium]MDW8126758.1 ferritin family protein [Candidatus Bipolaricaulota bacterium]